MEGENENELKGLGVRGQPEVDGRLGVERVQRRMRPSETGPGFDPAHWSGCRGDGKVQRMREEEEEKKIGTNELRNCESQGEAG